MGVFAETLFDILNSLKRKKAQRIPSDIRSRLERLFDAPGYGADYAICETTRRVRWLFYIDPAWVTKVVIPFFDLHHSRSEPAWNGLLYDNRLPDAKLFGVLKPHFLKVFPHSSSWAWDDSPIRRLNEFLVVACYWNLNDKHYISYAEARSALQQATEEGREHAIWFLAHIVRDLNEWSQFGKPFVEQAWPRERKYQTSTSSRNFARLAEEAGDNFPDVVRTILPLLGPVEHGDMLVHSMKDDQNQDASLAVRFPESALSLLDRVVPQHQTHGYYELRAVFRFDDFGCADASARRTMAQVGYAGLAPPRDPFRPRWRRPILANPVFARCRSPYGNDDAAPTVATEPNTGESEGRSRFSTNQR
jgi:hypothetical protein